MAIERAHTPDEITGLGVVSREGPDDLDQLYLCAASENPPNGPINGVEELLMGFGRRSAFTIAEVDRPGAHFLASGPAELILGLLLWHYPGEIEIHWPERQPADLLGRLRAQPFCRQVPGP
jgi:hypothetical protein